MIGKLKYYHFVLARTVLAQAVMMKYKKKKRSVTWELGQFVYPNPIDVLPGVLMCGTPPLHILKSLAKTAQQVDGQFSITSEADSFKCGGLAVMQIKIRN